MIFAHGQPFFGCPGSRSFYFLSGSAAPQAEPQAEAGALGSAAPHAEPQAEAGALGSAAPHAEPQAEAGALGSAVPQAVPENAATFFNVSLMFVTSCITRISPVITVYHEISARTSTHFQVT